MNKPISDQTLASQVERLPNEIQPQRDLWSGIERAIQDKSQHNTSGNDRKNVFPMAWAASICAAVLIAWVSFSPTSQIISPLTAKNEEGVQQTANQLVSLMQESFQQQKQVMLVSYGQPDLSNLPNKMQSQLVELAKARASIEKALANDENNADLINLLRFTQQQELNLLQQLYPMLNNDIQWQTI